MTELALQQRPYPSIEGAIGNTPLVRLQRIPDAENIAAGNILLGKLEGDNPAGSVKDRPAMSMIARAQARGTIRPGDTLIEATSGNTGIALAMAAAIRGYRMVLIMPENLSVERRQAMRAYGAELILAGAEVVFLEMKGTTHAFAQLRKAFPSAHGDMSRIFAAVRLLLDRA